MVKLNSPTRFSSKIVSIILVQTDTTVGFLSQNVTQLSEIKARTSNKPFIQVFTDFKTLKESSYRIPNRQKNRVRRAKKITFIVKNRAFRVATYLQDSSLLQTGWNYSTSANEASKNFDRVFCEEKADIIIENKYLLHEGDASSLLKINAKRTRKLR